jgi:hypothetical protein
MIRVLQRVQRVHEAVGRIRMNDNERFRLICLLSDDVRFNSNPPRRIAIVARSNSVLRDRAVGARFGDRRFGIGRERCVQDSRSIEWTADSGGACRLPVRRACCRDKDQNQTESEANGGGDHGSDPHPLLLAFHQPTAQQVSEVEPGPTPKVVAVLQAIV